MALPVNTGTVPAGENSEHRTHISSGGNYYWVGTISGIFRVYKCSSDPNTCTPAEVDSGNRPTTTIGATYSTASESDGTYIHMAINDISNGILLYHRFNMSTDQWDQTDNTVYNPGGKGAPSLPNVSIAIRPSVTGDELVIAADIEPKSSMGSSYPDVGFFHGPDTGTPSWTGPISLSSTPAGDDPVVSPTICTGNPDTDNVFWFIGWDDTSASQGGFRSGYINTSNTSTDTAATSSSSFTTYVEPSEAFYWPGYFGATFVYRNSPYFAQRFAFMRNTEGPAPTRSSGGSISLRFIADYSSGNTYFLDYSQEAVHITTDNARLVAIANTDDGQASPTNSYQRMWTSVDGGSGLGWTWTYEGILYTYSWNGVPVYTSVTGVDTNRFGWKYGFWYDEYIFGTTFNTTISESTAITSTQVGNVDTSVAESTAASDTPDATKIDLVVIAESNAISETNAATTAYAMAISESAAVADAVTGTVDGAGENNGVRNETVAITEAQVAEAIYNLDISESVAVVESTSVSIDTDLTESLTIAETQYASITVYHSESAAIAEEMFVAIATSIEEELGSSFPLPFPGAVDSSTAYLTAYRDRNETTAANETQVAPVNGIILETNGISETLFVAFDLSREEFIEISPFNDLLTGTITHYRSILENVGIAESTNVDFTADVEEAVILSETNYAGTVEPVSVSESAAVSETQVGAATRIAHRGEVASIVPYDKFVSIETDHIESVSIVEYAFVLGEYDLVETASILDTPNATIVRVSAVLEAVAVSETIRPSTWFEDVVESAAIVDTPDATYVDRSVDGDIEEQIGIIESTNVLLETSYNEETQVWDVPYLAGESYTDGVLTTDYVITLVQRDDAIVTVAEETEGAVVTDRAVAHIVQTAIPTTVIIRKEHKMESII